MVAGNRHGDMDARGLNARFATNEQVAFVQGSGGLVFADVSNGCAGARIALQGAQLLQWTPHAEQPVVWLSDQASFKAGKSVRGGVPICWPWFGAHRTRAEFPAHGYARTAPWEVLGVASLDEGTTRLHFVLRQNSAMQIYWPYQTQLECIITVGRSLEIELVTRNLGATACALSEALHAYFCVGDVRRIRVTGLENTVYLDKVRGFERLTQSGPITFTQEVDRVYVDTTTECIIDDPVFERTLHIEKRGSDSTVVWNPWIDKAKRMDDMSPEGYRNMVCVESANAMDNELALPAGHEHRLWVGYRVEHESA